MYQVNPISLIFSKRNDVKNVWIQYGKILNRLFSIIQFFILKTLCVIILQENCSFSLYAFSYITSSRYLMLHMWSIYKRNKVCKETSNSLTRTQLTVFKNWLPRNFKLVLLTHENIECSSLQLSILGWEYTVHTPSFWLVMAIRILQNSVLNM